VSAFEQQYAKEFTACRSILALADGLFQQNEAKVILDLTRHATLAVASLYSKARKQIP